MITTLAVLTRIFSNSVANLYQKKSGEISSPLETNLISYLIMSLICVLPALFIDWSIYSINFWINVFFAGLLCTIGTIALIEALKIGELSVLAPINSYKSVIGLISAIIVLHEFPPLKDFICIVLIIIGSYFVLDNEKQKFSIQTFFRKDIRLRIFALLCSGTEAAFLKKIIIMSSYKISLILWCFSGFLCSLLIFIIKKPSSLFSTNTNKNLNNCLIIGLMLLLMQLSTNFVFSKIEVGSALALFQLSSLVSLFFGYKYYHEKNMKKKIIGTLIMIGSAAIILI